MDTAKRLFSVLILIFIFYPSSTLATDSFLKGVQAYDQGDYIKAAQWYRKAAEQGDAWGQNNLGVMYNEGKGVSQDHKEAAKWYRKAAEQGNAIAQNNLGVMYATGKGVVRNYVQAYMWFNLAAAHKNKNAIQNRDQITKKMTPSQIEEGQRLLRSFKATEKNQNQLTPKAAQ